MHIHEQILYLPLHSPLFSALNSFSTCDQVDFLNMYYIYMFPIRIILYMAIYLIQFYHRKSDLLFSPFFLFCPQGKKLKGKLDPK